MVRVVVFVVLSTAASLMATDCAAQSQMENARARMDDLRLEVYATSRLVEQLAQQEAVRQRAWATIQRMGITKVYLEVYRSGHIVSREDLVSVRDWLQGQDIDVIGGIATVPGGDFGVRQEGPLGWFNWQAEKTQRDLVEVIRNSAGIFDTMIVDDFFCTGDVSDESKAAKGDRSWGQYRRDLLTDLAQSVFVGPAKAVNPSMTLIIKYPQWYDRFHRFGYDTVTLPEIFDQVWVGTESRGRTTRRFGFVQPYEGFINYRWLADIARKKIRGAWFDHGDCQEFDFLDQAYMSVLAGARELVLFNLGNVMEGHPDHAKLVSQFAQLADLASAVRSRPVVGIPAYKPPNSDPRGDMYLLDFLGMLGIPLVPVSQFPEDAPVIFLPAHAAADPQLLTQVRSARQRGAKLIMTTSLLSVSTHANQLAKIAGISQPVRSEPMQAQLVARSFETGQHDVVGAMIDIESSLELDPKPGDLLCQVGNRQYAFLSTTHTPTGDVSVLNTHTFSQADFDAVGEVLLAPRPLGLLAISGRPLRTIRDAFRGRSAPVLDVPSCVTLHPLNDHGGGDYVIQNFNNTDVQGTLTLTCLAGRRPQYRDAFTGKTLAANRAERETELTIELAIPARGRIWVQRAAATP